MRLVITTILAAVLAAPAAQVSSKEPEALMDAFLTTLQTKKYEGALQKFFSDSLASQQKPQEMKAMDGQVKAAFEFFGPPRSWEVVETKKMGKDLVQIKMISKQTDDAPLFWNALFYRRNNQWEPLGIYFYDDPRKAGFW